MLLLRNVGNYILIGDINKKHLSSVSGYKFLKRLFPQCALPDGYIKIESLNGSSVYTETGLLKPKYWALPRMRCEGAI